MCELRFYAVFVCGVVWCGWFAFLVQGVDRLVVGKEGWEEEVDRMVRLENVWVMVFLHTAHRLLTL